MSHLLPLATVSMLEERLGVPVGSLEGLDLTRAERALEDASHLVRAETGIAWVNAYGVPEPPEAVVVVVLQIAKRVFINPDNLTSESVGSYSWQADQASMGIYLSDDELRTVLAARDAYLRSRVGDGAWGGLGSVKVGAPFRRRRSASQDRWEAW